jgi:type IV secretory pathway VirB10-like protein
LKPAWRTLVVVVAAAAFSGCATVDEPAPEPETAPAAKRSPPAKVVPAPAPPPPVTVSPPVAPRPQIARASEVETLITDFERMRRMGAPELAREQELARQAFNQSRSDTARVRLAMVLGAPGGPGSEAALELLDPVVKSAGAPLHALAFLLASYIQESRRLALQLQGLQQNVQGLQQNVQALQQKLDALRSLERSLTEREAGSARRR